MNKMFEESPRNVVVNMLDCNIIVSEFELQLLDYIPFWTKTIQKGLLLKYL